MPTDPDAMKRYNLAIPKELYDAVKLEADKRGMTFVDLVRKFMKIGLLAIRTEEEPNSALLIREGDSEKQILIF